MIPVPLPILDPADPCGGCLGSCCRVVTRPPFHVMEDPEWTRLRAERPDLAAGLDDDLDRRSAAGGPWEDTPCLWLDPAAGRCRHYAYRPAICRDFAPGSEECGEARAREGVAS
jgi:Fe-S-cluster containining protein